MKFWIYKMLIRLVSYVVPHKYRVQLYRDVMEATARDLEHEDVDPEKCAQMTRTLAGWFRVEAYDGVKELA